MRLLIIAMVSVLSGYAQAGTCIGKVSLQPTKEFSSREPEVRDITITIPEDSNASATVTVNGATRPFQITSKSSTSIEVTRVDTNDKQTTKIRLTENRDRRVDLSGEISGNFGKVYDLSATLSCRQ